MSAPVWVITGASSGFGKGIALAALKRGHKVIATARTPAKLEDVKAAGAEIMALDVTQPFSELEKIASDAYAKYGSITHLVNSAGYILDGAVEETSPEESLAVFNTNVLGTLNVTRAFLPYLREEAKKPNTIKPVVATFGSLGSWESGPGYALYGATKWAVSGMTECLRYELEPLGLIATVIEPGYFRSNFLTGDARVSAAKKIQAYEDTVVGEVRKVLDYVNGKQPGDIAKGVEVIVDVLTSSGMAQGREIPLRLVLGTDCIKAIRNKIASTEALLKDWEQIICSTDHTDA